ncbi:SERF1B isoform 4 [Pongo abelii]|uniref:SERF1B isoform 4 n=2 Tax=Pongo abelii TaxID=9601 RepID=A0A2J8VTL3_PONAB|nr:SERF1B isoform 4 [Pongo abelii]
MKKTQEISKGKRKEDSLTASQRKQSSGGQKSENKVSAGPHLPLKAPRENPCFPLPAAGGPRYYLAYGSITPISAFVFVVFFSVFFPSFYEDFCYWI